MSSKKFADYEDFGVLVMGQFKSLVSGAAVMLVASALSIKCASAAVISPVQSSTGATSTSVLGIAAPTYTLYGITFPSVNVTGTADQNFTVTTAATNDQKIYWGTANGNTNVLIGNRTIDGNTP